ncbi:MAG: HupE/UreJ family protein [Alphaproteobacteria bacterium]
MFRLLSSQKRLGLAACSLAFIGLFAASAVEAHTGLGDAGTTFSAGFMHPFGGLDHVLAMLAVGLYAAQKGGRALWLVPAAFLAVMALGGLGAAAGLGLPLVEIGILGSLIVFGAAVLFASRVPLALGAALVALFAVFHGHAHGAEILAGAPAGLYVGGFVLATGLLHGIGLAAGLLCQRAGRAFWPGVVRAGGAAVAATGLVLLIAP